MRVVKTHLQYIATYIALGLNCTASYSPLCHILFRMLMEEGTNEFLKHSIARGDSSYSGGSPRDDSGNILCAPFRADC